MEGQCRVLEPQEGSAVWPGVWDSSVPVTWGHLQGMTTVPLIVVTVPFSPILGLADAREVR